MYRTFSIENFRIFKSLKFEDLGRVNLVSGKNNTGKTTLLEALAVHATAFEQHRLFEILDRRRGLKIDSQKLLLEQNAPWDSLFHEFSAASPIRLVGTGESASSYGIGIRVLPPQEALTRLSRVQPPVEPPFKAIEIERSGASGAAAAKRLIALSEKGLIPSIAEEVPSLPCQFDGVHRRATSLQDAKRYNALLTQGKDQLAMEALVIIEPRLKRLALAYFSGQLLVHGDLGNGRLMPLRLMGSGMSRLLTVVLKICTARGGIALIDEIENGLYYSALADIWKVLAKAARLFDVQVFLTTHSFECIATAHEAFSKDGADFRFHRLDRLKDGEIRATTYDRETLGAAIESGFEVR